MKGYRLYALVLAVLFSVFVVVEYYRPKPIDWRETLSNKDKIPYGTFVLYELLPDLFPDQPITSIRLPIVNQVEEAAARPSGKKERVNYLFVDASFALDSLELKALLSWVEEGNNVFISARRFSPLLQDTLGFKTAFSEKGKQDSLGLTFTHPQLRQAKPVRYAWAKVQETIEPDSGANVRVLGRNTAGDINFVEIPLGKGRFYLSSVPLAFANYHVIDPSQTQYAAKALSHLPVQPVWWDEYQKQGPVGEASVFRVLLEHEALTLAYYLTLASLLLFVVFESKRTQRIIPIMEKPRNTTLEFVQVIGNLYYNYRDHRVIAEKKINYFLEYLRRHYYESTSVLDEELQERVTRKSGVDAATVERLFQLIRHVRGTGQLEEKALWQLNQKLESFYRQARR